VCERIIVIYRKRIILHNLAVPSVLMARGLTPPDVAVHREQTRKPRLFFGVQILYNKLARIFFGQYSPIPWHVISNSHVAVYREKIRKPEKKRFILD
jgi:hypothetical protein